MWKPFHKAAPNFLRCQLTGAGAGNRFKIIGEAFHRPLVVIIEGREGEVKHLVCENPILP